VIPLPRRVSSRRAAEILRRLFGHVTTACAFRLWDGTTVVLGPGAPVCTAVVHDPGTFIRLIRDPTPLNFAEAYVEGALDLEGDLFRAMSIADSMEEVRVPLGDRLRILLALWRR
jgi:cyclopropane-fatty-acyl-phospholipid synthase